MKYEIVQHRKDPGVWHVERIDEEGDGEVYVATFSGPLAYERALEYALWKSKEA